MSGVAVSSILCARVLPNIAVPLLVEAAFAISAAILAESGLSFLGIGISPPTPSLGTMLREGARYMLIAPHLVIFPGIALLLLVLGFNLLGEHLRNKLDGRTA